MRAITSAQSIADGLIGLTVRHLSVPGHETELWSLVFHGGQWEVRNSDDVLFDACPNVGLALETLLRGDYDKGPLV